MYIILLQEHIDQLSTDKAKSLLLQIALNDAECSQLILSSADDDGGPNQPPAQAEINWCICSHCQPMSSQEENTCCGQNSNTCKSVAPGFDIVILDRQVLRLAMLHRNDLIADENLGPDASVGEVNRSYRHAAYRQFILSQYGRLGQGVRRVIPSCCVLRIRRQFPDPEGVYKGWKAINN